ncbi:Os08g0114400 [Oryza sativa Japonica Group]|uniref:Os08g0114400 protein n=2 Tax=Oryza sativa subsp. japonica TaxID=39947 RepID=A0A0P0XB60_ORYSJ|nr:hypothetical protein EE612_041776 [Oryza sativa]BAD10556.1 unknown protein [Oryza sativa Japonica Group]BAF22763.1 Os08g0114400 [Oryza sativa Japonica Group]BAT03543.1 Os08g0114400 [Oryza sativa Japonica Group]|eukprot:NP_001060849.1 Os08g0114400 [Oryza sativa Japonica Group]
MHVLFDLNEIRSNNNKSQFIEEIIITGGGGFVFGADPGLLEKLPRAAEVAELRRAVGVVGADAEAFNGAALVDDVGAPADAQHLVAPLAGEDAVGVVSLLHLDELAGVGVLGGGAVEGEVTVLPPVRDGAVLAQRHLLQLVEHVGVRARLAVVVAPVVGDVEVDAVLRLAEVGGARLDVAHEDAELGVDVAEGPRVEVAQPHHVGDERRRPGQRDAEAGVVQEGPPDPWVPGAGGEEAVLRRADARPRRLDPVLEPDHRPAGEEDAVVGEAVGLELEQRRRQPRREAAGDVGAVPLQPLLGGPGGDEAQRRLRAEAEVVVEAVPRRGHVDAVVLPVDHLPLPRQPRHVAELVRAAPHRHLLREVRVVPRHEPHRPLELRLQLECHLQNHIK